MPTSFSSNPVTSPQGPFVAGATSSEIQLGAKFVDQNGNAYRYCLVGGTALVPGKLYQAPAEITAHQNIAPTATFAIGATSVTVTLGATAVTANQYAGGYLIGTITPGQGYKYVISSHPAADASATLVLTLSDPLLVAVTTSSRLDMVLNPYRDVIVNPTTASSCVVGAAIYPVAASAYGWLQTGGIAPLLVDDQTIVVGTNVAASNQAAGAIEPHTGVQALVGIAVTGGATTDYCAVKLTFDVG
jgi:hypothetical protein